jgi:hypothetical protein
MTWVAHTWSLLAMCAITRVAYIAKCAMYAPPTERRLSTQFLDTTLASPHSSAPQLRR